jgi:hypothetical protein
MRTLCPSDTPGGHLHSDSDTGPGCNVLWAFNPERPGFGPGSGGFVCIPGSHKAMYPLPRPSTTSIDLEQVVKPGLSSGDVLFFHAVVHGTTAWHTEWERRSVVQFYQAADSAIRPPTHSDGGRGHWNDGASWDDGARARAGAAAAGGAKL